MLNVRRISARGDVAAAREQAEDRRHRPGAEVDAQLQPRVGGSMRGGLSTRPPPVMWAAPAQQVGVVQGAQRAHVDARRAQQRLGQRLVQPGRRGVERQLHVSRNTRRTSE